MFLSRGSRKIRKITKAKSCTGKAKMTEPIARTKVKKVRTLGAKMYAYKCSYCKFPNGNSVWHIGHRR